MYIIINNCRLDLVRDCSCIKGLVHVFSCPTAMILLAEEDTSSIVDVSIGRTVGGYCGIMFIRGGQCSYGARIFHGSWGRYLVDMVIKIILINIKQIIVYTSG